MVAFKTDPQGVLGSPFAASVNLILLLLRRQTLASRWLAVAAACTVMLLQPALAQAQPTPAGRTVVIEGLASNVWQVSVDGAVQPGSTVRVEPGDTVEWRVAGGFHGVTFPQWSEA